MNVVNGCYYCYYQNNLYNFLKFDMKQIKIGRSSDNDIVITDLKVSSHHCRVYESAGSFYVEDTGSLNGVKVNNVLIHE